MNVMISALLAFLGVGTPDATAGFDLLQLVEVMANTEIADGINIGSRFGPDPTSPLSYSAYVDLANGTFSYSLVAGSTYLGSPITQQTTGAYDSTTGAWDLSSTGTANGQSWSGAGSVVVTGDPTLALHLFFDLGKIDIFIDGDFTYDLATGAFYSNGTVDTYIGDTHIVGPVIDVGSITVPVGIIIFAEYSQNSSNNNGGPMLGVGINEQPIGLDGGPTGFTQVIGSVPEPSSLSMVTTSTLILIGVWSRHRTRRTVWSDKEGREGR